MSNFYFESDHSFVDYAPVEIPGLAGRWRGPAVPDLRPGRYAVAIGAGQTFGRFVDRPFSTLLSERLKLPVVNLGIGGAGITNFRSQPITALINQSKFCVVQVMSGRSGPNAHFDSSSGANVFGLEKGNRGPAAFAEYVMEHVLKAGDLELARRVVHSMRRAWTTEMYWFSRRISVPKVLLWFSERDIDYIPDFRSVSGTANLFPQFIDLATYESAAPYFQHRVEVITARGKPHIVTNGGERVRLDMGGGRIVEENRYYPSPQMHEDAAYALADVCEQLAQETTASALPRSTTIVSRGPLVRTTPDDERIQPNFLIIGAAKSGTSALANQLARHPDIFIPESKELHFFDRLRSVDVDRQSVEWREYMRLFQGASGFARRGEATVAYTMAPMVRDIATKIYAHLGTIPLIYIVRDPLDRIVSQYRHGKRNDSEIDDIDEWIETKIGWNGAVLRSNYMMQIEPFLRVFGEDNVQVLFYEDYKNDYEKTLESVCSFLGVSKQGIENVPNEIVNKTSDGIEVPLLSDRSLTKIRAEIAESNRDFLARFGKSRDFWASMS